MRIIAAVILAGCVSACATPVDLATARNVPAERVYAPSLLEPQHGLVPVTLSYDQVQDIGTMSMSFYIDGKHLATMVPGEKIEFFVSPGRHVLVAQTGTGKAKGKGNSMTASLADYFVVGGTYEYRMNPYGPSLIPI